MGKGGGCMPSKSHRLPLPTPPHRRARTSISPAAAAPAPRSVRIYVVFYSMNGHVRLLACSMQREVSFVPSARGILFRIPETLPRAVLAQMGALKPAGEVEEEEIPVVDPDADGFLFGFPARYGAMAAQMQAFFDSTAPSAATSASAASLPASSSAPAPSAAAKRPPRGRRSRSWRTMA